MQIIIIVATDKNGCIGKKNQLPWHLPADLAFFKQTTSGQAILMGRKTYESIGKPLPNRLNLVVSSQLSLPELPNLKVFSNPEMVLDYCHRADIKSLYLIGGGQLYKQMLSQATTILRTLVDTEVDACDTYFPDLEAKSTFKLVGSSFRAADEKNKFDVYFQEWVNLDLQPLSS
jgi:dihydrofolate reductase